MNEISLRQLEANVSLELSRISKQLHAIDRRWKSLSGAVAGAEQNVNVVQRTLAEGLSSQLEFRTAESSFLETKGALSVRHVSAKCGSRRMGSRDRSLLSVFRGHRGKPALVAAVEVPAFEKIIWLAAAAFVAGLGTYLFSELAGGGGRGRPARHGDLGGLRNGADRADSRRSCSRAERRLYSTGGSASPPAAAPSARRSRKANCWRRLPTKRQRAN